MKNKAIFLDKDGTLIPDIPYNVDSQLITLQADAIEGLKRLQAAGYLFIVVSNQSGVARGIFEENMLKGVEQRIRQMLSAQGIGLTAFYYCPHHPKGIVPGLNTDCNCRKPEPGMLFTAAVEHHIDLGASWMIGDILNDVEAGNRAGCSTVLIDNGNETEWVSGHHRVPTVIAKSIDEAAILMLKSNQHELAGL
ncbi:HAD family hydrolase [Mucilaginibacter achroorhodeus]|uniref:D,D-heptose 1,7-bisphosphate phosphatase n=1 Tax=Mucilaginibacter achroorhodeus TaxID=2599294 RepID=A0A563U4J3_9SPHI|nr:HAD family hydrolase [Mucilaginibacter achroorhodeus]TWR26233.1 HAD family hydrolase [Mucilaginibacter achroorhodeus]